MRTYKSLGQVGQAFRCIKILDLRIRPIHHRIPDRVRAHLFLCLLAYYVEWHMRKAWVCVLFQDGELDANRWNRDPAAKAQSGETVQRKKQTRQTGDGWPVHSFQSLMEELATRCKNTFRAGQGKDAARFTVLTEPTDFHRHVFGLIGLKSP